MDDLDVALDPVPFMVSGDEHDHPVFDKQIAMATLNGVAVPDA
jgi:hypothetical protein